MVDKYLSYIASVRRFSPRTVEIYRDVLGHFCQFARESGVEGEGAAFAQQAMTAGLIRSYEVQMLDNENLSPRTVNQHLSVLSGWSRFLMHEGVLSSNPVSLVTRPKMEKRLPVFYQDDDMEGYFSRTQYYASQEAFDIMASYGSEAPSSKVARELYEARLRRLIVSLLHASAMRRSELISLNIASFDASRQVMRVRGKGDKMREIPLISSVCEEISLYLQSVETMVGGEMTAFTPLLQTLAGRRLYPVYVDRAVKGELGRDTDITSRKSPHVLRHTLATELLNDGADLNSIKELLGHASLAATQVYTHNSIAKLKNVYNQAHPRAKTGVDYGDKD